MLWSKRPSTIPVDRYSSQRQLASLDACDACGSKAFVYAMLPSGGEVLLCRHHGTVHAEALRRAGALVRDEA